MMKKIFKIFKKIIISSFLLYGFNVLASPLNIIIPINVITVFSVAILGIPAIVSLAILLIYIY